MGRNLNGVITRSRNAIAPPPTSQTAIPTERFAIAPLQLPKQRFLRSASLSHPFNSPNSELTSQRLRYRIPSTPKQRFLRSASLSHPFNSPNSDRTPSTSQTAIPTERFAMAHFPPKYHFFKKNLDKNTTIAYINNLY